MASKELKLKDRKQQEREKVGRAASTRKKRGKDQETHRDEPPPGPPDKPSVG